MLSAEPVCSCAHFFVHLAHETAGAARTRHSLLPLLDEGQTAPANLGQIMPRERGVTTMPSHPRGPGQASDASADPGSIRRGRHYFASGATAFAQQFKLVAMDPGFRRDDEVR